MKQISKTFILSTLVILFNSRSSDNEQFSQDFTITLETECGEIDTRTTYCVTEEEVDNAFDNDPVGNPCYFTTIKDIDPNGFELTYQEKDDPYYYFNVHFEHNKQVGHSIDG